MSSYGRGGRGGRGDFRGGGQGDFRGGGRGDFRGSRGGDRGGGDRGRGPSPGRGRGGFAPREQGGVFVPPGNPPARLDSRVEDNSDLDLVKRLNSLRISGSEGLPLRPGYGTLGAPIKLRTNYFPIKIPKKNFYEYDVAITPARGTANRRVKRRIFQLAEQSQDWASAGLHGQVAHDHSAKIIAAQQLPQPLTIRVPWVEEDGQTRPNQQYVLTIKYVQAIDTTALLQYCRADPKYKDEDVLPIISALNLILATHPNSSGGGVMVGRNRFFFPTDMQATPLGGGLEAFRGFYSSVRPTLNQLMVNVNVCTTAFYTTGNLAVKMMEFSSASFGARMNVFVKGVRVRTKHLNYTKTVKGLSSKLPSEYHFDCEELGGRVSVQTYFDRKYHIKLRYPDLPLVDVGGQKSNYLPPEVCDILPNQPFRGKLLDEQTASMITVAAKPPNINGAAIVGRGLELLGYRGGADKLVMNAFGVSIGTQMAVVPGRILRPPGIQYGQGKPEVDDRASWNLRNVKFTRGGTLSNWAVLLIRDGNGRDEFDGVGDPNFRATIEGFVKMCRGSGMKVPDMPSPLLEAKLPRKDSRDPIRSAAIGEIRKTISSSPKKPSFLLVILSNGDKNIYSGLKHLCDCYLDVPTVCVHSAKIRKEKGQLQYFANVALKVNMKLGGVNHALDSGSMGWLKKAPTMLVGIDVTHPSPGSVKGTPSIAAVVASVDSSFAQYPASMELQESRKEMVTNLAKMMEDRLKLFRLKNGNVLPARVLVYRDGVSEGQFNIVVNEELPAIRAAFRRFSTPQKPYEPKLAIVICGKRHHTRFYPTDAQNADRDGNPKAGTVVDRGVTAVYNFDFFLQAHGGLQGTTKPTHYYVVHDEMNFSADDLQQLTNSVSYMFARATKAVSLASPAYYADLACERGRCYIHKLIQGGTQVNTSATGAEEAVMNEAQQMWHGGPRDQLKDSMYYL
ncbi:Piwi-domain-containing protein [Marasmius fiardii PR-910]|nr:Piwi-domain-containing protein [Marasmius fiardii PR-910]